MVSQVPFHCNSQFKVFNYVSNFGSSCRSETENIARRLSFWRVGQILGRERERGGRGLFKVSNSISVDSRRQRLPSSASASVHPPNCQKVFPSLPHITWSVGTNLGWRQPRPDGRMDSPLPRTRSLHLLSVNQPHAY